MSTAFVSFRHLLVVGAMALATGTGAADDAPRTAGPYVPTPQVIVDRMLQMGQVTAADFVIDLGSGDGRIVRTAAKTHGANGFGVDIDTELVERSNAAAKREGIADRAKFYVQDVFKADLSKATVVTLYVLPAMMTSLRPKLLSELKPGTRVVSHDYHFQEWLPDSRMTFDVPEKQESVGFSSTSLYLWVVPALVGGRWQLEVAGQKLPYPVTLTFSQVYQYVNGNAEAGARRTDIGNTRLRGDKFEFAADIGPKADGDRYTFRGTVQGNTMQGEVVWGMNANAKRHTWKATRLDTPVPLR
jgi:phospholipid N-methyltransferase